MGGTGKRIIRQRDAVFLSLFFLLPILHSPFLSCIPTVHFCCIRKENLLLSRQAVDIRIVPVVGVSWFESDQAPGTRSRVGGASCFFTLHGGG